jgi:hypothetical protein
VQIANPVFKHQSTADLEIVIASASEAIHDAAKEKAGLLRRKRSSAD